MERSDRPGRGRPRRTQAQTSAERERVIAAARRLFAQAGYGGVSMRKIAADAECSPAALYTLFPSKRSLLRHLWERVFLDLAERLRTLDQPGAAGDRLARLCFGFVEFWLARPDDYRAIFLIEDRLQDEQDRYFVDSSDALRQFSVLHQAIVDAQAQGELRQGDPMQIQNILFCGMQGLASSLVTIPEYPWGDRDELIRMTVRALLDGLR